jgi:hypothetical protein
MLYINWKKIDSPKCEFFPTRALLSFSLYKKKILLVWECSLVVEHLLSTRPWVWSPAPHKIQIQNSLLFASSISQLCFKQNFCTFLTQFIPNYFIFFVVTFKWGFGYYRCLRILVRVLPSTPPPRWYWGLNSRSTPRATSQALFCEGFFQDRISWTLNHDPRDLCLLSS